MKTINNFILEKLKLNNQSKLTQKDTRYLTSIYDAQDGDIITDIRKKDNTHGSIYIFKKIDGNLICAYCYYDIDDKDFNKTKTKFMGIRYLDDYIDRFNCWLSTENEKREFFNAMNNAGYKWDPNKKELKEI